MELHVNFFREGNNIGLLVKASNAVEAQLRGRRMVNAVGGVIAHYGKIAGREYLRYGIITSRIMKGGSDGRER